MKTTSIFRSEPPKRLRAPAGKGASRALMLDHYEQHLRTSTNRKHLWLGQGSTLPLSYGAIRLMPIRRSRRAGYDHEHAAPQMFRHTFAHDLRANGGAIDDLVHHMGWQGPAMAYRYGKDMAEDRAIQAKRDLGPLY